MSFISVNQGITYIIRKYDKRGYNNDIWRYYCRLNAVQLVKKKNPMSLIRFAKNLFKSRTITLFDANLIQKYFQMYSNL